MTIASLLKKALIAQKAGDLKSAEEQYRHIRNTYPNHPDAHNLLGCLFMTQGKYSEAEQCIQKSIQIKSNIPFFYYHLGLVYAYQKQWKKAKDAFIKALKLKPSYIQSYNNLGIAYRNLHDYARAIATFRKGLQYDHSYNDLHCNLGGVYSIIGDSKKAINHLNIALKNAPKSSVYHREIAILYQRSNLFKMAEHHLLQAIKYNPDCVDSLNCYAVNLKNQGKLQEAYQRLNQVVAIKPDYWDVHGNILFLQHYMHEKSPSTIFQAHVDFGQHLMNQFATQEHKYHCNKDSQIRVGYVSPDFKRHSVAFFIESILRNHDCQTFEIFCYANVVQPDDLTKVFQSLNVKWRDIYDVPDSEVISQIKADQIDILIDLAGHSANNRMPLFAQKPAPIQITYLGYPNTSGLPSMDYRITDKAADSQCQIPFNTEKLLYMEPCFLCYTPPESPPIKKRPMTKPDSILFGSFNTLSKINDHVIEVWAEILKQLPHSKLLVKNKSITDPEIKADIQNRFQAYGIHETQLVFKAYIKNPKNHLSLYQTIDIALDTFPYNGTTTTFEALWMGIPVIGLVGETHVSRVTYSILNALGLTELIGCNETEYIQKAIQLAGDYQLLRNLNKHLRIMMQQSILTDAVTFTRKFEALIRQSLNHRL